MLFRTIYFSETRLYPSQSGEQKVAVVKDFTGCEYSSASFYEKGIKKYEKLVSIHDTLFN